VAEALLLEARGHASTGPPLIGGDELAGQRRQDFIVF
jgi:hypothetical protein